MSGRQDPVVDAGDRVRTDRFLDSLNPDASSFLEQTRAFFYQQTGDPAESRRMSLQVLADLRRQQAASFAYFDIFWVAAIASLGLVFLVFLMKRSVADTTPGKKRSCGRLAKESSSGSGSTP
jgi:hypothetical protein